MPKRGLGQFADLRRGLAKKEEGGVFERQGFIQAILMPGRWHKKLNFLIEISKSIFIKFYSKHFGVELTFKIN